MQTKRFLDLAIAGAIFLIGWNILLWDISLPRYPYFDEIRYISAGRQLWLGGINENWAHPPLGKFLIGGGIQLFGDNSMGWRFMSSVAGALILMNIYLWGLSLFRSRFDAVAATALTLFNQVHFIQSRIATLDVFMVAFMLAALSSFSAWWLHAAPSKWQSVRLLGFSTVCFGLGIACKWIVVAPAILCLSLFLFRRRKGFLSAIAAVLAVVLVYFAVSALLLRTTHPDYAPKLGAQSGQAENGHYNLQEVIRLQAEMFKAQLRFNNPYHPYYSHWATWPLMIYPVWYDFRAIEVDGQSELSGIGFLGNPMIFWTGILAILCCGYLWLKRRSQVAGLITLSYMTLWLVWAPIPRSTGFLYYYYPAAMLLGLAIVNVVRELKIRRSLLVLYLLLSAAVFCFFYPVLTDKYIPAAAFHLRILFHTWI